MSQIFASIYVATLLIMSVYGLLGLFTLALYWRHRHEQFPTPPLPVQLPRVTVQLPIYNEQAVVGRLIDAAVSLNYPRQLLQIQVIDDSTDETTQLAAARVRDYQQQGINICLIHRQNRQGFKAGALQHALDSVTGEFIALFDADFVPQPDFLLQTIPHFAQEPELGMIQARWGHLNAEDSLLTAAQAIALDKHFAMEQTVRHRANLFPKFNGAGGVWRRTCLEDAGGWEDDTVCEDLCLSTRAILQGWSFRFLDDVVAPAELPTSMSAYKNQQARWAKGSSQCLLKYGRSILTSPRHPLIARLYAVLSMSAYTTHLLLLLLLLLQLPLILLDFHFSARMLVFTIAGVGQPILFVMAQRVLYTNWRQRLRHFPSLLVVAIGIGPSTSRAILAALLRRPHTFIRTPKQGTLRTVPPAYRFRFDWIVWVEVGLVVYTAVTLILAVQRGNFGPLFLLGSSLCGFAYVAIQSMRDAWSRA